MHYSREYIQFVRNTVPISLVVSAFKRTQEGAWHPARKSYREVCNLQPYGGSAKHKRYRCLCPFHIEKTPSFFVMDTKGSFTCLGCGERGDAFGFVMKMRDVSFPQAVRFVALLGGIHPEHLHVKRRKKQRKRGSS